MPSRFSSDLVRSSTDLVLLTLLTQRPMYGYEILTTLQDHGNGQFRFKHGTLYPLLYRLEREGWIEARWEDPPEGKPRKVYRVTRDGRREQKARTAEWLAFTDSVKAILEECGHA